MPLIEKIPIAAGNWSHLNDFLAIGHNVDGTTIGGSSSFIGGPSGLSGFAVTNSSAANAAALTAALTSGSLAGSAPSVFILPADFSGAFPQGYPCDAVVWPSNPFELWGAGWWSRIDFHNLAAGTAMTFNPNAAPTFSAASNPDAEWYFHDFCICGSFGSNGNTPSGMVFPTWNVNPKINVRIARMHFSGFFLGVGLDMSGYSGMGSDSHVDTVVANACQVGFKPGSDQRWVDALAHDCQNEGFYWDSFRNSQMIGLKAYNCGKASNAGHRAGFNIAAGGVSINGGYCQDNWGAGAQVSGHGSVITNLVLDRNNQVNETAQLVCADYQNTQIRNVQSIKTVSTNTVYSVLVTDSGSHNLSNTIEFSNDSVPNTLTPVDPASSLLGTEVRHAGADGEIALAFVAGGMTPNPYLARTQVVGLLTANMTGTIAVPAAAHRGQEMSFRFTQDGTGGRTISWAAGYKQAFSSTGNTLGKVSVVDFRYDGTNWVQVGSDVWV